MLVQVAELSFQRGMQAMGEGKPKEALAFFEAAVELERRHEVPEPQARYLSYLGLCLGMARLRTQEAVQFCRRAVSLESYNPDFRFNLARVLLSVGRRRAAHEVLQQGLAIEPGHEGILRCMERMGFRRRPPIPFLARSNPINVFIGRQLASIRRD